MYRPVHLSLDALTQTDRQLSIHGYLGADGHLGIGLQRHHLLAVETGPDIDRLLWFLISDELHFYWGWNLSIVT
jgi:hypothetical protein